MEVDRWTQNPILANIGTFAVPLLTYMLIETHIKGVHITKSDKDAVLWISFILKDILEELQIYETDQFNNGPI